ncbi:MAG: hypothetical protein K8R73_00500 [Clostridiales bacterium]|nr:hypothetical protein [Clostridiales bacterium]
MNSAVFSTRKAIFAIFLGISILGFSQGISNLIYGLSLPLSIKASATVHGIWNIIMIALTILSMRKKYENKQQYH